MLCRSPVDAMRQTDVWPGVHRPALRSILMPAGRMIAGWRLDHRIPWFAGKGFAANVAFMVTGTALGQGASVLLAPVLTRLYSPEQFGYLSVYTATLTILVVVAALGFELAIPIAGSDEELANLLAASG